MNKHTTAIILALALLIAPAFAQDMKGHEGHAMPASTDDAAAKAFKDAHVKMMQEMEKPLTGNPDVDFVQGMIPHHQGAVDMAKVELQYGKDAKLRKLARAIIAAQEKEIAEMQAWLKKNRK
jgi:uncharacterized protein (DUF305 family)